MPTSAPSRGQISEGVPPNPSDSIVVYKRMFELWRSRGPGCTKHFARGPLVGSYGPVGIFYHLLVVSPSRAYSWRCWYKLSHFLDHLSWTTFSPLGLFRHSSPVSPLSTIFWKVHKSDFTISVLNFLLYLTTRWPSLLAYHGTAGFALTEVPCGNTHFFSCLHTINQNIHFRHAFFLNMIHFWQSAERSRLWISSLIIISKRY